MNAAKFRILRLIVLAAGTLAALGGGAPPAAAQNEAEYLTTLPDFPLMPGLIEQEEPRIVFDKPGGRIIEGLFSGPPAMAEVRRFYLGALPGLGWDVESSAEDRLSAIREDERLILDLSRKGGRTLVGLRLEPAG